MSEGNDMTFPHGRTPLDRASLRKLFKAESEMSEAAESANDSLTSLAVLAGHINSCDIDYGGCLVGVMSETADLFKRFAADLAGILQKDV